MGQKPAAAATGSVLFKRGSGFAPFGGLDRSHQPAARRTNVRRIDRASVEVASAPCPSIGEPFGRSITRTWYYLFSLRVGPHFLLCDWGPTPVAAASRIALAAAEGAHALSSFDAGTCSLGHLRVIPSTHHKRYRGSRFGRAVVASGCSHRLVRGCSRSQRSHEERCDQQKGAKPC